MNTASGLSPSTQPKTFDLQQTLPRFPIQDMGVTTDKFIEWVTPLLSAAEMQTTKAAVAEFIKPGGDGEKLHQALENFSKRPGVSNWLEPIWNDFYLGLRDPAFAMMNFFVVLKDAPLGQVQRAAQVIHAATEYKQLLDNEAVPVDSERGRPLCMMLFQRLFGTSRVAGQGTDQIDCPYTAARPGASDSRHVLVAHKGNFFEVEVLSQSGELYSPSEIARGLENVLKMGAQRVKDNEAVGVLTTEERDRCATARKVLLAADPRNAQTLQRLERALFCVCLDDAAPQSLQETSPHVLHGDMANRWFDKSIQAIVFADGRTALNAEHSGLDGTTLLALAQYIAPRAKTYTEENPAQSRAVVTPLTFHFDDELRRTITKAATNAQLVVDDIRTDVLEFADFGKDRLKSLGVSPDAFVQIGLQAAHYKLTGALGSVYEPAMIRGFLHGRTEALRTLTPGNAEFVKALGNASISKDDKLALLKAASDQHTARMMECKNGAGVERYLFGLLNMYKMEGAALGINSLPEIFSSPGWVKARQDVVSTSNMSSPVVSLTGIGPPTQECLEVFYSIEGDRIQFNLNCNAGLHPKQLKFIDAIRTTLNEMLALG